jgi:hypothetical protein
MPEDHKKTTKPKKEAKSVPANDECESNTGQPNKGPRKPQCPDGYPNEQPKDKSDAKR